PPPSWSTIGHSRRGHYVVGGRRSKRFNFTRRIFVATYVRIHFFFLLLHYNAAVILRLRASAFCRRLLRSTIVTARAITMTAASTPNATPRMIASERPLPPPPQEEENDDDSSTENVSEVCCVATA